MKRSILWVFILLCAVCRGATGDVTATINPDGWSASISIAGFTSGATYNFGFSGNNVPSATTPYLTVVSLGFDDTGTATTVTRTVYLTSVIRFPYSAFSIPGSYTSGTFVNGETITQAVTGATAIVVGPANQSSGTTLIARNVSGSPTTAHAWTGGTSGAIFAQVGSTAALTVTTFNEEVGSTGMTVQVALSDYVYQKDNTGGGNSGTAPTITIPAAFITNSGGSSQTSNALSGASVTQSSTAAYQRVIANWSRVPYTRITGSSFSLGAVGFHASGQSGRPVRVVKFTAADAHSHTTTTTVTSMSLDTNQDDAVPVPEYIATMDATGLTALDVVTCNFTAYPWIGDSASVMNTSDGVNSQPTPLYAPITLLNDKSNTYGVTVALVDPAGSDSGANTVYDIASYPGDASAYKFATIGKAASAIASYNNSNHSRNTVGAGIVYLNNGNYNWVGSSNSYGTTSSDWITVTRSASSTNRASAVITDVSGDRALGDKTRLYDLTVNVATGPVSVFTGANYVWFDHISLAADGVAPIYQIVCWYITQSAVPSALAGNGLRPFGTTNSSPVLIRGNDLTGCTAGYVYTVLGNKKTASGDLAFGNEIAGQTAPTSNQPIFGYNKLNVLTNTSLPALAMFSTQTAPLGGAIVQNLLEYCSTSGAALVGIANDSTTNSPINNVILWNNTFVGQRINRAYNDNGTAAVVRTFWCEKNNIYDQSNIKTDVFGTPNGSRTGNWGVFYGVSATGNLSLETTGVGAAGSFGNKFYGVSVNFPTIITETTGVNTSVRAKTYAAFVNRDCNDGSTPGSGNGDYHLQSSSPAVNFQKDFLIPFDLAGLARSATDAVGVYHFGGVYAGPWWP